LDGQKSSGVEVLGSDINPVGLSSSLPGVIYSQIIPDMKSDDSVFYDQMRVIISSLQDPINQIVENDKILSNSIVSDIYGISYRIGNILKTAKDAAAKAKSSLKHIPPKKEGFANNSQPAPCPVIVNVNYDEIDTITNNYLKQLNTVTASSNNLLKTMNTTKAE